MSADTTFSVETLAVSGASEAASESVLPRWLGRSSIVGAGPVVATLFALSTLSPMMRYEGVSYDLPSGYLVSKSAQSHRQTRQSHLADEIASYANLEVDWDGRNSPPPLKGAIDNALLFLKRLPGTALPNGPLLETNGEVGLYWKEDGIYVDVTFDENHIYYFAEIKLMGGDPFIAKGILPYSAEAALPPDLATAVELLVSRVVQ